MKNLFLFSRMLFLVSLVLSANIVRAADWKFVADSASNGDIYEVDASSIEIDKFGMARYWQRITYLKPIENLAPGKIIYSTIVKKTERCKEKSSVIEYATSYDQRGEVVSAGTVSRTGPIIPDSVGEAVFNYVCSFSPLKKDTTPSNENSNYRPPTKHSLAPLPECDRFIEQVISCLKDNRTLTADTAKAEIEEARNEWRGISDRVKLKSTCKQSTKDFALRWGCKTPI